MLSPCDRLRVLHDFNKSGKRGLNKSPMTQQALSTRVFMKQTENIR